MCNWLGIQLLHLRFRRGDPLLRSASFYRRALITVIAVAIPAALSVPASAAASRRPVLTPAQIHAITVQAADRSASLTGPAGPGGPPGQGARAAAPGRVGGRDGAAPSDDGDSNDVSASAFALSVNDPNGLDSNWNDLGFEGYLQDPVGDYIDGVVYPGETLTATAIIFNEDNTCPLISFPLQPCPDADYDVAVTWQVNCDGTVTSFDEDQVVSEPTLYGWSYGFQGTAATPAQLSFQLTPDMCDGEAYPYNFELEVFTQVVDSTSPAEGQLTLANESDVPPSG